MTRSSCAGRSAAISSGTPERRPAAARRWWLGDRAPAGDAPASRRGAERRPGAPALLVAHPRRRYLSGRARRLRGEGVEVIHTLTRAQPAGWTGYSRRVDAEMLGEVAWPAASARSRTSAGRRASSRPSRMGWSSSATRPSGSRQNDSERQGASDGERSDGNAIAGLLIDVFGAEMTTATGVCAHCGARGCSPSSPSTTGHRAPSCAAAAARAC